MIENNFLMCDTCPTWLYQFENGTSLGDKLDKLKKGVFICEECLGKLARSELVRQIKLARSSK